MTIQLPGLRQARHTGAALLLITNSKSTRHRQIHDEEDRTKHRTV
jgi:hypothetical protein